MKVAQAIVTAAGQLVFSLQTWLSNNEPLCPSCLTPRIRGTSTDLIQGSVCIACAHWFLPLEAHCQRCALPLAQSVPECGNCSKQPATFDQALAGTCYQGPVRAVIREFKARGGRGVDALVKRLVLRIRAHYSPETLAQVIIIPVPTPQGRWLKRGFNPTHELLRQLHRYLPEIAKTQLLWQGLRVQHVGSQKGRSKRERLMQSQARFALGQLPKKRALSQKAVILDDVMTTGSTAQACARVLKDAGFAQVDLWLLARAPDPGLK